MSPRHNDESHSLNQPVRSVHLAATIDRLPSALVSTAWVRAEISSRNVRT